MHKTAVLQNTQNLGLRFEAHGCDFIKKQRAFIRDFEQTFLRSDGAGERPLDMAK